MVERYKGKVFVTYLVGGRKGRVEEVVYVNAKDNVSARSLVKEKIMKRFDKIATDVKILKLDVVKIRG